MDADPRGAALPSRVTEPAPAGPPIPFMREGGAHERSPFTIRPMTFEDIPFVVTEHLRYFPDGFFARLGTGFLSAYCETYVTGPDARGYISQVGHQPAGFLVGVINPAGHRGHILHAHRRRLAIRALTGLAVRPRVAVHFLHTRLGRYARKLLPSRTAGQNLSPELPGTTAVLAHVAVVGSARSRGVGAALIARFVADAADAGCARVSLVTLADGGGAGPYYERHGWLPRGESDTPEGRRLATYDFPLPGAAEVH